MFSVLECVVYQHDLWLVLVAALVQRIMQIGPGVLPFADAGSIELPLPLFDFGDAARAGGEARYLAAFNRTREVANNASSQVRVAYDGYRSAHDLARHYRDEVVPLRRNITEESVLQYNGMLIGVFELLAAARAQSASAVQAIEAEREAFAALERAGLSDVVRPLVPSGFTFWDYKQLRFPRNEGMRIDFIMGSPAFAEHVDSAVIARDERKGDGPSDHVPVVVDLVREGDEDDRPMIW